MWTEKWKFDLDEITNHSGFWTLSDDRPLFWALKWCVRKNIFHLFRFTQFFVLKPVTTLGQKLNLNGIETRLSNSP